MMSLSGLSSSSRAELTIASTTSIPLMTLPKTGCFAFRKVLSLTLRKNCEPPVFGPAFAIEIVPRALLFSRLNSSLIS